jgi:hypothetical protein
MAAELPAQVLNGRDEQLALRPAVEGLLQHVEHAFFIAITEVA